MADPTYDDLRASVGPSQATPTEWNDVVPGRITGLARVLAAVLAAGVALDLVAVVVTSRRVDLLRRVAADGFAVSTAELERSDTLYRGVAMAQLLATLVVAVLFVTWLWRAYDNAARRHAYRLRHSRGWVVGAWFVPILNLFRPKQIVDDVWRGSRVDRTSQPRVPGWLHAWWAALVLGAIAGRVLARSGGAGTIAELHTAAQLSRVADAMDVVAGVLAILLVVRLSANQRTWLTEGNGPPA